MRRPYLILINNVLAARHCTRLGALRHIEALKLKGITGVIAYEINGGALNHE